MFDRALLRFDQKLNEALSIANWHEKLRDTIFAAPGAAMPIQLSGDSLVTLREAAPQKLAWRLFDHYASLGQIYAVFELAIIDLVEEYVRILPTVTPKYSGLPEGVRTSHRIGVGHVLMKWNESQPAYKGITEPSIAAGLADGLRGQQYSLLGSAFLTDSDNYRPDTLNRVFKKIGFDDAFSTIKKDPEVIEFCTNQLVDHTAESYLVKFVLDRNVAAHGDVSEIATIDQINKYAYFVRLLVRVYSRLLQSALVKAGVETGKSQKIGSVARVFSNGVYGVKACIGDFELAIGQRLFVGSKSLQAEVVRSLRRHKDELTNLALDDGLEFGLGLVGRAKEGDGIFITSL